jgi:diacylglycerol O-acyltransferase / wax synthase
VAIASLDIAEHDRPTDSLVKRASPYRGHVLQASARVRTLPDVEMVNGMARMFLGIESDDFPMDGAAMLVLDSSEAGPDFGYEAIRATLARKARAVPVLRKKLVRIPWVGPGHLAAAWVEDDEFRIDRHLDRTRIRPPGDLRALADLTIALSEHLLPHDRPLWKATFVEGLEDGRVALILRAHHAAIDAMAGMQVLGALFDVEPNLPAQALAVAVPATRTLQLPAAVELAGRSLPELITLPVRHARRSLSLVRALSAGRTASEGEDRGRLFRHTVPDCLFNRTVEDTAKSLALLELPMGRLKACKNALGVTLTDLMLALVTASLREYLARRDEDVTRPIATLCPMNVRLPGDTSGEGNHFLMMVNRIPIDLDDSSERVAVIRRETTVNKRVGMAEAEIANTTATFTDLIPAGAWPLIGALPDTVVGRMPAQSNLTLSSIPGPPVPLYLAGAKLLHMHMRTFVQRGSGLFVSCAGYHDTMDVGITSLQELVPDPESIAEGIERELAVLEELAGAVPVALG